MIPQFLVVPLFLEHWGELQYSIYITCIAGISIFSQVQFAMQNGYILKISGNELLSINEIFSMLIMNLVFFALTVGILLIIKYTITDSKILPWFVFFVISVGSVYILNTLKLLLQVRISIVFPLAISLLQSMITLFILIAIIYLDRQSQVHLIEILLYNYLVIVFLTIIISLFFISRAGISTVFSIAEILKNYRFLISFGGLSLVVTLINSVFANGAKIFLGTAASPKVLVDFNLSFTLCMLSAQFISPILGLIFPYLAKDKVKSKDNLNWIFNVQKLYWAVAIVTYFVYIFCLDAVIVLWLGAEYIYLSSYVMIFLLYFFLKESASIGVQYFKVENQQQYTVVASFFSFLLVPVIILFYIKSLTVWIAINIFCVCSFTFLIFVTYKLILKAKQNKMQYKNFVLDTVSGFLFVLFVSYAYNQVGQHLIYVSMLFLATIFYIWLWFRFSPFIIMETR